MISRIYVIPKIKDSREKLFLKSWNSLDISGNVRKILIADSYLIDSNLSKDQIIESAKILTNQNIEKFFINEILEYAGEFDYIIEIGFLPGVTDNVGSTAQETILDLLHFKKDADLKIYTSKVFIVSGEVSLKDIQIIASSLYNPLIERTNIADMKEIKKNRGLSLKVPEVILEKKIPVIKVSLSVPDDELIKISKEGIFDGARRGPLALSLSSMKTIQEYFKKLKRNPTDIELESLAQTWSEHCKHTIFANPIDDIKDGLYKTYIKGATNEIRKQKGTKDFCVSVFSDNSGGIIFDDNYLITHKVETHNSPSALDPFGGAITGIVGVNRDTIGFGLGAKPVANTYGFCFGFPEDTAFLYRNPPTHNSNESRQKMFLPKRIMEGVIKGVNVGGNCSGIPTISGFIKYDDRFKGKPLVFVGTVGLIPRKINGKLSHEKKAKSRDYIVVVGGRVGADGIHGATFSSVTMDSSSPATAVQIGDPITQKKMSDAIVKEARDMNLYNSITDNGAGGISCSVAEMAKECNGAIVYLEKVPIKYPGLSPWQIWISESQERMTLSIPKKKWEAFKKLMESRGVEATVIGEFINSGKCVVKYKNETIVDIDLDFLHNGFPKSSLFTKSIKNVFSEPKESKIPRTKLLLELLSSKNISGFSFIGEQYDHEVQASSVLKPISGRGLVNTDAQVFRPVLSSKKGVVLSASLYPSYGDISAYDMASCALDTAIRNIVACGGTISHLAILDNFCWCSSYNENRLYELVEAVKSCTKHAVSYGTPLISGKDSMFNDFKGYDEKGNSIKISVPPTLLISSIGLIEDVKKTVSIDVKFHGDLVYILGETKDELGGSEYFAMNKSIGNNVPKVEAQKNKKMYSSFYKASQKQLISSAISITRGGLGVALVKTSVSGKLGVEASLNKLPGKITRNDFALFSESQGRILITINPKNKKVFEKIMKGNLIKQIGQVTNNQQLVIKGLDNKIIISLNLEKLEKAYKSVFKNY